jgi:hypothetical protein
MTSRAASLGPVSSPAARGIVEIACDESGFVGGSLFGGTRVFTHASVRLDRGAARDLADEVRRRLEVGTHELKASRLNRPWARPVASWLCAPDGPLAGRAVVHVTDTRLFGLARLAQVLTGDEPPEGWWSAREVAHYWELALRLHEVLAQLPAACERELLIAARDLLWVRRRRRNDDPIEAWTDVVGAAATALPTTRERRFLAGWGSPEAVRRAHRYVAEPPASPLSEPLLPALRWAVRHWSARGDVDVVHDEQSVLTPARVRAIADELAFSCPGRRLVGFARVDSKDDPRVQVADLLAGVVRRAYEELISSVDGGLPADSLGHLVPSDSPVTGQVRPD